MGLLDALFDQTNYGGQGGGLLDLIRGTQAQNDQYQPAPGFQPMPQSGSGRDFNAGQFDPTAYAPNQAQPIAVGNYQMPRIGSAPQFASDPAAIPPAAQPAQGQLPPDQAPQMAQQPATQPAFLQSPGSAGGFGGAARGAMANMQGGPLGMIGGALAGVMGMGQGTTQDVQRQNLTAQYQAVRQALIENGETPQAASSKAMVAALNPEAAKTILPELFTSKTEIKMVRDAPGAEHPYSWNSREQTFKPVNADGEGSGGGMPGASMLAPGVKQFNPSLSGQDYLNQFGPEVQAAAKAYANGDVMPTGNPRAQGIATLAKTIAQKVGMDTGNPVSDATYAAKRKMQTDLASSSNSTMGGILSNGESSFKHLAEYTMSAADQGNVSYNFPLGGAIAHTQNYVGNAGGGSNTQAKVKAINDNLGKYGAESTKFYAGTGGGVEERLNALKEMNGNTTSGEEAAAYAEKEKSLMLDRLNTKFQEIRNTLGEERGNVEIAKHMPDIQKNIDTIDANIKRLRGGQAPAQASPTIQEGATATNPQTGAKITFRNGKWQ